LRPTNPSPSQQSLPADKGKGRGLPHVLVLFSSLAFISGHPLYCPRPVLVTFRGSARGGSMLKVRFIGRGMRMEFHHPDYKTPIVTSPIQEIQECT